MKKLKRSNSKEAKTTTSTCRESSQKNSSDDQNMSRAAVKSFDELVRCTNVLAEGIENEFLKFVQHQEDCRKKWLVAEEENHEMKKFMAKHKADKDTIDVKLKMARHQLDDEIKKRLKAEQRVDHMGRQLQLIKELLLDKDGSTQLSEADKEALAKSIHQYNSTSKLHEHDMRQSRQADLINQSYTLDESSLELDWDNTDDDILDTTGGSMLGTSRRRSHKRGRSVGPTAPPLGSEETTSTEDNGYVKRTKVIEETSRQSYNRKRRFQKVHKTIETHVHVDDSVSKSPSKYATERLDRNFPKPKQEKRTPSKHFLKESASTGEITTDYEFMSAGTGYDTENSTPRTPQHFILKRHQQHTMEPTYQQVSKPMTNDRKQLTKQNTVPSLYPSLEHLSSPDPKKKFNTLSTPRSAAKELGHSFVTKITLKMETCTQCGKKLKFYSSVAKCKDCKACVHLECQKDVPIPCVKSNDTPGRRKKEGTIESYIKDKQTVKVPLIVESCIEEIENRGMKELGLYRVPGMDKDVRELKEKFLRGKNPDLSKYRDIHVVCGCLKDFIRGLSEPLVTHNLHESFMVAATLEDPDDSLSAMYQCVSELPQANRDTLAAVMLHLQKVSQSSETQMGTSNLAKVFGPTIVGHRSVNPTHMEMLEDIKSQPIVVTRLLEMPCDYWNQFSNSGTLNAKTPPYNPNYYSRSPRTPDCKPVPESILGPVDVNLPQSASRKKYNAMTPKYKNNRNFFNSPS